MCEGLKGGSTVFSFSLLGVTAGQHLGHRRGKNLLTNQKGDHVNPEWGNKRQKAWGQMLVGTHFTKN